MRSLRQISITVLAGALLIGATSIALAQQTDEASELNKIVIELYKAGQYADAIPIAQQVLAMRERALGVYQIKVDGVGGCSFRAGGSL